MTDREVLELLQRMDEGYCPSAAERAELGSVNKLSLCNKGLARLPESIGSLSGLTHLNLFHNNLTSLPDSIGNLKGLTTLGLLRGSGRLFQNHSEAGQRRYRPY